MKRYRYTLPHILLLSMLSSLLLISCKDRNQFEGVDPATVQLSIPKMTPRSGGLAIDGVLVQKLRILVFNKQGGTLDAQKTFFNPPENLGDWLRVEAHEGQKTIHVIANEADGMTSTLDKIVFERDLYAMEITDLDPSTTPIIMIGQEEATLVKDQVAKVTIQLSRTKAKITLDLRQETAEGDNVVIRKVSIDRLPKSSKLFTPVSFTLGGVWTFEKSEEKALTNHAPDAVAYIPDKTLYSFENLGSAADSTNRAPRLIVEALYNGVPTTYSAYINDETSDAPSDHYALLRNHHYKLTGRITKIGQHSALLLTTRVVPWDLEEIDKTLQPPYLLSIDPVPNNENPFTATESKPIEFKVKILSDDITQEWRASLTNALDFEIDTTGDAVRTGLANGGEYTIRVKASKPAGYTIRTTHLIFTTDLVEVHGAGFTEGIKIIQLPSY